VLFPAPGGPATTQAGAVTVTPSEPMAPRAGPSQHGCMRVRIAAAVLACLATAGVSGCTQPSETCAVADYGGGTGGYQTPQEALQSVLAGHQQWLSETGWKLAGRNAEAASFVSGNDRVDVVKNKAGRWMVGGVTACK